MRKSLQTQMFTSTFRIRLVYVYTGVMPHKWERGKSADRLYEGVYLRNIQTCVSIRWYISSINECGWFYFFFHHTYTGKKFSHHRSIDTKNIFFSLLTHTHTYVFGYAGFTTKIIEELCVNSVFNGVISYLTFPNISVTQYKWKIYRWW